MQLLGKISKGRDYQDVKKRVEKLLEMIRKCLLFCLIGGLAMFAFTGCMTTYQTNQFHVAVVDADSTNSCLKFYRVTIKARASNVKTDLQTGYYDANAVRQLYGDVSQGGEQPAASDAIGQHQFVYDDHTGQWQVQSDKQLFTIVYGVDAKAIATEINTFTSSDATGQQFGQMFASLAGGNAYQAAIAAQQSENSLRDGLSKLAANYQNTATNVANLGTTNITPEQVNQILLQAAQATVKELGSKVILRTDSSTNGFSDAEQVYQILSSK